MNRITPRFALASLVLLAASAECAAQSRVLFSRSTTYSDGTVRHASVYRIDADGTDMRQLTPTVEGNLNISATWSPHGRYVTYALHTRSAGRADIYVMTNTGAGKRRISSGSGDYGSPVWRPDGGRIAFNAQYSGRACVATVRPDGVGQRDVFCVPSPWYIVGKPQWSLGSTRLYVATSMRGPGLEPPYYSRAYRVNANTGEATLLTSQVFEDERPLHFNPDGRSGVYANHQEGPLERVDFATDALTHLAVGFDPVYSRSGTRIAFSATRFGAAPGFNAYANLFVVNVDGTGLRQVTHTTTDDVVYTAAEWSRYNTHLLVNRTQYMPSSPGSGTYVGTTRMRVVSVATGRGNWLPRGWAGDWYQGP